MQYVCQQVCKKCHPCSWRTYPYGGQQKGTAMAETKEIQQAFLSPADVEEYPSPRRDRTKISLPRVLALLRPYRWRLVVAAVLLVLTNGLGLLFSLVIRTLLNTVYTAL